MGWLWGSGGGAKDQLDPSLRDFLDKENPTGPKPSLPSKPVEKPDEASQAEPTRADQGPVVPPQSQFQDGRYAHLWKNYVPQRQIDDRGKNEQDRLRDAVDAYNDRKAEVGRVAMENCALEYIAQFDCYRNPKWGQVATLCRTETRAFNRCYDIQSKFLKALGYMTMDYRSDEDSEKIQMHADRLYQQMLAQEQQIEEAKKQGLPPPQFDSIFSKANIARAMNNGASVVAPAPGQVISEEEEREVWARIKPESRKLYEQNIAKLPPEEQDLERKALLGELKSQNIMARSVEQTFIEERINRLKRKEAGQSTIGDIIKSAWGWD
ncbi:unnamed protein product [Periconia digitata]|uniref:Autophagy-related protein 6 n=1 Tax=Periconia digitata TaxID=1303443 RepID=A0A9W4UIV1_9PLEO|nr:unnamed protein product [Periconia digitata]